MVLPEVADVARLGASVTAVGYSTVVLEKSGGLLITDPWGTAAEIVAAASL